MIVEKIAMVMRQRWLGSVIKNPIFITLISFLTGTAAVGIHYLLRSIENPRIWSCIVFSGGVLAALMFIMFNNLAVINTKKVIHDTLTKRHSYGFLEEGIHRLLLKARSGFQNPHLLVAFVDGDKLKRINDTKGHDVGDLTIIQMHEFLSDMIREGDYVLRKGGDEFIILALTSDPQALAKRFREACDTGFKAKAADCWITMSIGFSWRHIHDRINFSDISSLIANADSELYKEKEKKKAALKE